MRFFGFKSRYRLNLNVALLVKPIKVAVAVDLFSFTHWQCNRLMRGLVEWVGGAGTFHERRIERV